MQITAPDYYKNFKCIAGRCRHSCCIGWEIDIDDETLEIYKNVQGELGSRLKKGISFEGDSPHFITDKNGRCPFLNQSGLCDIINELGEDGLCQICYDHPRFRNYFKGRLEIGLGLCCESAAELILNGENKFSLTVLEDDGIKDTPPTEIRLFSDRDGLFDIFQNRSLTIEARMLQAAKLYNLPLSAPDMKSLAKIYHSLERLDPKWDEFLNAVYGKNFSAEFILSEAERKLPLPTEKLLCYFTYRYFASAENTANAVKFILQNTFFCLAVCFSYYEKTDFKNFLETCRQFSLEVEYSEENTESLLISPKSSI